MLCQFQFNLCLYTLCCVGCNDSFVVCVACIVGCFEIAVAKPKCNLLSWILYFGVVTVNVRLFIWKIMLKQQQI